MEYCRRCNSSVPTNGILLTYTSVQHRFCSSGCAFQWNKMNQHLGPSTIKIEGMSKRAPIDPYSIK